MKEKLEKLEARAAQLAEERAEELRAEAKRLHEEQHERLKEAVKTARTELEKNRAGASSVLRSALSYVKGNELGLLIGVFMGTLLFHMIVFPSIGRTPAEVVCPLVCPGCSRPARVFSWNFKGQWHSENGRMGYAFVCSNPKIDVRGLAETDIWNRNRALQPYMLNAFAVGTVEAAILTPIAALVAVPILGLRRRRRVTTERARLEAALEKAERELAEREGPSAEAVKSDEPYR